MNFPRVVFSLSWGLVWLSSDRVWLSYGRVQFFLGSRVVVVMSCIVLPRLVFSVSRIVFSPSNGRVQFFLEMCLAFPMVLRCFARVLLSIC